jgi:hypothetical protein
MKAQPPHRRSEAVRTKRFWPHIERTCCESIVHIQNIDK